MVNLRNIGQEDTDSLLVLLGDPEDFSWWGPEQRLAWALVERTLKDAVLLCGMGEDRKKRTYQITPEEHKEAVYWFWNTSHGPWTFKWVADVLRLMPGHVETLLSKIPKRPYGLGEEVPYDDWHHQVRHRAPRKRKKVG